jgi:hypothetical protein
VERRGCVEGSYRFLRVQISGVKLNVEVTRELLAANAVCAHLIKKTILIIKYTPCSSRWTDYQRMQYTVVSGNEYHRP